MGFGGDIYPRAYLHAGSISICQESILASSLRRELDTCPALPISTNHPMVLTSERDDFLRVDRNGNTAIFGKAQQRSSMSTTSAGECTTALAVSAFGYSTC